ncbi:MAG TPA: OB-fold nucleic acid binding domain-containing protein [Actinomycetota bacterium]|jgi:RecG-like helicase|nr:OB-fold nucleic acid binding domain-containing protein [Actinomycetota bacterium]
MGWLRRLRRFFTQSDEERLAQETREWAERVPGTHRIAGCPSREEVRVAGTVSRLRLRPMDGMMTLEAVISDGTGELTASWTGRSHIPGLTLGTPLVLQGVVAQERTGLRMVNPRFEFA